MCSDLKMNIFSLRKTSLQLICHSMYFQTIKMVAYNALHIMSQNNIQHYLFFAIVSIYLS